jgi:UDP-3-O-[3-hydroxymyristoyl] N-acetylglucosamine deacetylase
MLLQKTIAQPIEATGIGLHSGQRIHLHLKPAQEDEGIYFVRTDLSPPVTIPVHALGVTETTMASTLSVGAAKVQTVEHFMSALAGLGVDNLRVEISADEMPIMDGSAATFVYLLEQAGLKQQKAPKKMLQIVRPIRVTSGDKWAELQPWPGMRMSFEIAFNHPAINQTSHYYDIDFAQQSYMQWIANARTFGFVHEVEYLRERGLARGGNLDNAIVMDEYRIINAEGLRDHDEFVKHKILDAMGDLYLIGRPILGWFNAYKSGHALNNQLIRAVLAQPDAWREVTYLTANANLNYPLDYASVGDGQSDLMTA